MHEGAKAKNIEQINKHSSFSCAGYHGNMLSGKERQIEGGGGGNSLAGTRAGVIAAVASQPVQVKVVPIKPEKKGKKRKKKKKNAIWSISRFYSWLMSVPSQGFIVCVCVCVCVRQKCLILTVHAPH